MVGVQERHAHPKFPRLSIQLRSDSRFYQAVTFLDGKLRQKSLKTCELPAAFKVGEDWYRRQLRASVEFGRQHPIERLTSNPVVAELFASYRSALDSKRRADADKRWSPIQTFWRPLKVAGVQPSTFREFYKWRRRRVKGITPHTLHKDVVLIRQVLKFAAEEGMIERPPVIPRPGRIVQNPRPWLTPAEWKHLLATAQDRVADAPNARTLQQRSDLLDMMLFLVASCCRVGEMQTLRFQDCRAETTKHGETVLIAEVTGKRGTRTIVTSPEAAYVIGERQKTRKPDDLVFPEHHRDAFRELLKAAKLERDTHGFARNMKSLRATAISFRVLKGDDLWLIARNAGTSITMIDTFYARRLSAELGRDVLGQSAVPA